MSAFERRRPQLAWRAHATWLTTLCFLGCIVSYHLVHVQGTDHAWPCCLSPPLAPCAFGQPGGGGSAHIHDVSGVGIDVTDAMFQSSALMTCLVVMAFDVVEFGVSYPLV